ncbi:hypothetical protein H2200_004984 [Cladophialophora chaetospira]|uniref:Uncharacterized protein n=1 Tax=Cladophialophora chaetospira TaxID=386627 RepID=A0AA38XBC2_9EURO|nr:hypothetical protein H2200_004984 [Cladophialophora chaetospira]
MCLSPGFNETELLCTRFAHAIESTKGTAFTLELGGNHLPQLPMRIGSSKVLDSAVACALAAFTGLQCPHRVTKQYQHKLYIQALSDMRQAVEESRDMDFEAVFAAMILLGDYEVCSRTENALDHAKGAEAILKAWGPGRLKSAWAMDLLDVMGTRLIAASISTGEECFLDGPEWAEVFDLGISRSSTSFHNWASYKYLKAFARLANIVRLLRHEATDISPPTKQMITGLWIQVSDLNTEVETLMHDPTVVCEQTSRDKSNPFETYYRFSKVQVCEKFSHVWKIYILVSTMMEYYLPAQLTSEDQEKRAQAAINICKCFEFLRPLKPMGTMFLHLNLPRAAAALPQPYQSWAFSAYTEIVESALSIGVDITGPTELLKRLIAGWNLSSCREWWLGGWS